MQADKTPAGSPVEEALRLDQPPCRRPARLEALSLTVDEAAREILEFQIALIDDDELVGPVRRAIAAGAPAPEAWRQAWMARSRTTRRHSDAYFRARSADLADLRDRVLDLLTAWREIDGDEADGRRRGRHLRRRGSGALALPGDRLAQLSRRRAC